MITLGASTGRLQASSRQPCTRHSRTSVPRGYRPVSRQQLLQRRRIVAAASGSDDPLRFDDRSTPDVPADMAPGLKDQQTGKLAGGPADTRSFRDLESSDTNPAMDPSEQSTYTDTEGSGKDMSKELKSSQSGFSSSTGMRDQSDLSSLQGSGGSGGAAPRFDDRSTPDMPTSMGSSSLKEQQTGKLSGGPADATVGQDVESSDTNPAMDPSEQSTYTQREGSGTNEATTQFRSSESEFAPVGLRDQSDQASNQGTGGGAHIDEQRSHPVARTGGTAIGSAVGTVLGAVGGPIGAAAGAALGASAGRGLTDLMSGTSSKEQAEIYEQGAEPEQVLEEIQGVTHKAKDKVERAGHKINDKTEEALDRAEAAMDEARAKADKRRHEAKERAHEMGDKAEHKADRMSDKFDNATSDLKERTRSDESSGRSEGGGSSGSGHKHGGLFGALESAVNKVEKVTGEIDLPEFPPKELENLGTKVDSKQGGSHKGGRDVGDKMEAGADRMERKFDNATSDLKERARSDESSGRSEGHGAGGGVFGALESAVNKVESKIGKVDFPEFPPKELENLGTKVDSDAKSTKTKSASGKSDESQGGWGASGATAAGSDRSAGSDWVGDWGSEAATSTAASQGLTTPSAAGQISAGGSGLGGLGDAEAVVKSDVGTPSQIGMESGGTTQGWKPEGVGRAGGVAAAGGYGSEASGMGDAGYAADQGRGVESMGSLLEGINSLSGVAGASYEGMVPGAGQGSATTMGQGSKGSQGSGMDGIPEGRLRVGGDDAQAAVSVDADANAAITSDSTAQRIEQVFGVGPDASPGVAEAKQYKAEAQQEGGEDHGQSKTDKA